MPADATAARGATADEVYEVARDNLLLDCLRIVVCPHTCFPPWTKTFGYEIIVFHARGFDRAHQARKLKLYMYASRCYTSSCGSSRMHSIIALRS